VRAHLLAAALCAGLLTLVRAAPARAVTDSILVRVAGNIAGRAGNYVDVPITVDLSGAPGRALGSYRATLRFNPGQLEFSSVENGAFATPQANTSHVSDSGMVVLAAVQPSGATGTVVLFSVRLYVLSDTGQSPITVSFDEMSATATSVTPFESLLPLLRIVNGTFCKSLGRWGDVNGDGDANSLDALVALSTVVGIPVDTTVMTPALADVDGDGKVTSRDALIILSYAVGLPVTGYRVLLNAPGACGTGTAVTIFITPDSLELQVGQSAFLQFDARDGSGRSVSTDSGSVTSSDPSVAAFVEGEGPPAVQARAPGVAVFTAQLGPGVAATFKVVVLARRTTWYVDVQRARLTPTQLGNQALPMEFIGDALGLAHDGDTVRVASGIYEEEVSGNVAVTILGDSTNRPVIDPRGAPSWSSYNDALDLEPNSGMLVAANLVVRAGMVYLSGHDIVVRNVAVSMLGGSGNAALELVSGSAGGDAPPARVPGPERANAPAVTGTVLVDGVAVTADSTSYGILVDLADTAVIRNSTVTRASLGNSSCSPGPYTSGGIVVRQASVSAVHNNVVTKGNCQGIGVFDYGNAFVAGDVGRATISQNRVIGSSTTGIAAGARLVALDHNLVQNTGVPGYRSYGHTAGVHVIEVYGYSGYVAPDSVVSLGDSVLNSGGYGFVVDTAGAASLDSLVTSNTGQDSSGYGTGVDLTAGGKFALSHSHISNALYSDGVTFIGDHTVLRSHGNRIVGAGANGISSIYSCDCAPPARPGPAAGAPGPQRVGPYTGGPDTLISISDTILGSGQTGIFSRYGVYSLVDSAVVDSAGSDGIYLQYLGRATVSNSMARRAYTGIYSYEVDSMSVLRDTVEADTNGVYLYYTGHNADSATIRGSVARSNNGAGFFVDYYTTARVDSSVAVDNLTGLYIGSSSSGARVRWTRFQANGIGMWMGSSASANSSVINSNFLGDATAGVQNDGDGPTLAADTNYWGDTNGPRCGYLVGCDTVTRSVTGDSIGSGSITFADWLAGPAPTFAPLARGIAVAAVRPTRWGAARSALRPPPRAPDPDSILAASSRGRRAPATAGTPVTAPARRSQHQQPPSWHAPSKARTHAVQITVKKRT
jgi:hypothetical protein